MSLHIWHTVLYESRPAYRNTQASASCPDSSYSSSPRATVYAQSVNVKCHRCRRRRYTSRRSMARDGSMSFYGRSVHHAAAGRVAVASSASRAPIRGLSTGAYLWKKRLGRIMKNLACLAPFSRQIIRVFSMLYYKCNSAHVKYANFTYQKNVGKKCRARLGFFKKPNSNSSYFLN